VALSASLSLASFDLFLLSDFLDSLECFLLRRLVESTELLSSQSGAVVDSSSPIVRLERVEDGRPGDACRRDEQLSDRLRRRSSSSGFFFLSAASRPPFPGEAQRLLWDRLLARPFDSPPFSFSATSRRAMPGEAARLLERRVGRRLRETVLLVTERSSGDVLRLRADRLDDRLLVDRRLRREELASAVTAERSPDEVLRLREDRLADIFRRFGVSSSSGLFFFSFLELRGTVVSFLLRGAGKDLRVDVLVLFDEEVVVQVVTERLEGETHRVFEG
jgi:hypothetical protein